MTKEKNLGILHFYFILMGKAFLMIGRLEKLVKIAASPLHDKDKNKNRTLKNKDIMEFILRIIRLLFEEESGT
jgi:hypothetical protein